MSGRGARAAVPLGACPTGTTGCCSSSLAVSDTGNWLYAAATHHLHPRRDRLGGVGRRGGRGAAAALHPVRAAGRCDRRQVRPAQGDDRVRPRAGRRDVRDGGRRALGLDSWPSSAVIALTFVNNVFTAPYYPAVTAMTPSIVPERDLAAANALSGTIDNFALAFGPALVGDPAAARTGADRDRGQRGSRSCCRRSWSSRMRVHGKVGEVEAESSPALADRVAGARAIRGSKEAMLLIGLAVRVRAHVRPGDRAVRTDRRGVPGHGHTTRPACCSRRRAIGGILVTALAGQARGAGTHRGHPHRRDVRRRASRSRRCRSSTSPAAGVPAAHDRGSGGDHRRRRHHDHPAARRAQRTRGQRVRHPRRRHGDRHGRSGRWSRRSRSSSSACRSRPRSAGGVLLVAHARRSCRRLARIDRTAAARATELAPRVALLERLGIFEGTSPQQLEALAAAVTEEPCRAGDGRDPRGRRARRPVRGRLRLGGGAHGRRRPRITSSRRSARATTSARSACWRSARAPRPSSRPPTACCTGSPARTSCGSSTRARVCPRRWSRSWRTGSRSRTPTRSSGHS